SRWVSEGLTTVTRAPASTSVSTFRAAMAPPPTTRHGWPTRSSITGYAKRDPRGALTKPPPEALPAATRAPALGARDAGRTARAAPAPAAARRMARPP